MVTDENLDETVIFAKNLSKITGVIIAITGAIDIVADGHRAYVIRNGHAVMSKITGTGCMLTSIIGAFAASNQQNLLDATVTAVSAMGICVELAYERLVQNDSGTSSLKMNLIDYMSKIDIGMLKAGAKIEIR